MSSPSATRSVDAAVLLSTERVGAALVGRVQAAQRLRGSDMETVLGRLGGGMVSCSWPTVASPDWRRMVNAVAAGHHPRMLIVAGEAFMREPPAASEVHRISRVQASNQSLTLPNAALTPSGDPISLAAEQAPWAFDLCAACLEQAAPTIGLVMTRHDPLASDDPHLRNFAQQRSLAGQLGAVVGAVWREPAFASDAWGRLQRHWETQEALADAIEQAIATPR